MKATLTRAAAALLLFAPLAVAALAASSDAEPRPAADAVLYELTENMAFDQVTHLRTATAALQGTARPGSPLCPEVLLDQLLAAGLITRRQPCTVTAVGSDEVDTGTGAGSLSGTFAVVVNLDNPVDAAEFVVMTGTFGGDMQVIVDATLQPLPLIQLTNGVFTPEIVLGHPAAAFGLGPAPFAGTFRLPFALGRRGVRDRVRRNFPAFYLGDDGKLIRVRRDELSLDTPTVRVEVSFR